MFKKTTLALSAIYLLAGLATPGVSMDRGDEGAKRFISKKKEASLSSLEQVLKTTRWKLGKKNIEDNQPRKILRTDHPEVIKALGTELLATYPDHEAYLIDAYLLMKTVAEQGYVQALLILAEEEYQVVQYIFEKVFTKKEMPGYTVNFKELKAALEEMEE